jgi:hypothetical protein
MPTGIMGDLSKPIQGLLDYLKIFKKLSPGEKQAYLSRVPAEF